MWAAQRRSAPLWQGDLWTSARTTCRGLIRLGVDELAHVCSPSGGAYLTFAQAQDRWPVPGELQHEWDLLLSKLTSLGTPRASGFGHLSPKEMHAGVEALWKPKGDARAGEQGHARAARTGDSLGTSRHPSNLTITIGHSRDPRRSWLTRRRAESAAVAKARAGHAWGQGGLHHAPPPTPAAPAAGPRQLLTAEDVEAAVRHFDPYDAGGASAMCSTACGEAWGEYRG